ncbi:activator-dependent family glycosyltransferase [Amycolatopsis magusensis]|uniref:Glycosyltransferase (Activator-dependent family) n=1 Tax=Amycolatopsis magusensis TaxID=882444 RepID=A0ABS4PXT9_9PSEU|nr:activator-dependent family glycosyltransferase [Amycolatopsis magusensis]MBP2184252.1 glycosyltransferase (activator-dependent family) [Amycolatopsis magusensis]
MRVLFVCYAEKTHFLGMVPLAWALRTAGHDVRVASQPKLTGVITGAGLTAVPVGEDHKLWSSASRFLTERFAELNPEVHERIRRGVFPPFDMADDPDEVTWDYLAGAGPDIATAARNTNSSMIGELVEFARYWRPDVVFWEQASFAGSIAAKVSGAAHARFLWGLDFYGRWRTRFLRERAARPGGDHGDPLATWLERETGKFGAGFSEDMTTGQFSVEQLPASQRVDTGLHTVPVRYTPYGGPAVVPPWLWAPPSKPRVAITLGLTSSESFGGYLVDVQGILDSLADLDIEVVATVAEKEQHKVRHVPGNARVVAYAPLHVLAPTCSAIVHHAGAGTMATATLSGVPQLVLPDQADGWYTARRIAELGAGLRIEPGDATGAAVRDAVVRLLGEASFGDSAGLLRAEVMAMPAPNHIVGELVELTEKYRGREHVRTAASGKGG